MIEIEDGELLPVGELQDWHAVVAECRNCGHKARVSQLELLQKIRPLMPLVDAAFRLQCTRCGMDGAQRIKLYQVRRNI